jgi:hypothetical protein
MLITRRFLGVFAIVPVPAQPVAFFFSTMPEAGASLTGDWTRLPYRST